MAAKSEIGIWGETLAAEYLKKKRYRIVCRNFRVRSGEIDIIAENRDYLVFAEVKTRKNEKYGEPREFVGNSKQNRIRTAAALWLAAHPTDKQPRFDVIEIYAPQGTLTETPQITLLENAFDGGGF